MNPEVDESKPKTAETPEAAKQARRDEPAKRFSALAPVIAYAGLIFFLSAQSSFPMLPTGLLSYDKVIHCCEYSVLGFVICRALELHGVKHAPVIALALGALYGVSDEFHQYFVPGRSSDWRDALADTVGSTLGAFAWPPASRAFHRFFSPRVN
ncbi:MAG: VanZ family protein [Myxococcaceae bacterium]